MSTGSEAAKRTWLIRAAAVPLAVVLIVAANYAGREVAGRLKPTATKPTAPASGSPELSGLRVEPGQLDLGEVWEAKDFVAPLTLRNTTTRPVVVERFSTGCECSRVEPASLTVPAGEAREVRVHIDLTHRQPHQYGVPRRELTLPISPTVEGKGVSHGQWVLRGTVCSRASLADMALQFGDACVEGAPVSKSVRCHVHQPGTHVEAAVPPEHGAATVSALDAGGSFVVVSVTPSAKTPVGPFRFDVPLTVVRPDGGREPGPVLPVYGEVRSAFRVAPSQLLLGEHPVGSTAEGEFSVTLPPNSDHAVKQVGAESPDTTVHLLRDETPSGERRLTYLVRQRVAAGDQTATVSVSLANPRGQKETVRVRVSCYGIKPSAASPK